MDANVIADVLGRYQMKVKSPDVYDLLAYHFYNLIINICSIIATMAIIQNPKGKRVEPKHIKSTLEYVQKECYPTIQKGGSYHIDAQYFGMDTSYDAYQPTSQHTNMQINFENHIARPGFAVTKGGATNSLQEFQNLILEALKKESFLGVNLRDIFASHGLVISDHSLEIVKKVLKMHLNCFLFDLKEYKYLTLKNVKSALELERHAVFN